MKKIQIPSLKNLTGKLIANLGKARKIAIPISLPFAVILFLILGCAIGWAFFMGYMVGKGQNPEQSIHEMAGISTEATKDQTPPEEFKPEEEPAIMAENGQIPPPEPEQPSAMQFTKPEGNETEAWVKPKPVQAPAKPAPVKPKNEAPAVRYAFTYQAAAFKTKAEADRLKTRLEKNGIRCQTRKDGKVFLVTTVLRGTDAEAMNLRKKLQGMKLGAPLLLSKKPLTPQKGKKK